MDFAVGLVCVGRTTTRIAAGPCDERTHAVRKVFVVVGVYAGQALVAVVVAVEYHIGAMIIENLPEGLRSGLKPAGAVGVEWVMHVGEGALLVGGVSEVFRKPVGLSRGATTARVVAVAVEDDYVPASKVVAVVSLPFRQSGVIRGVWHRCRRRLEVVLVKGVVHRAEIVEVGQRL